MREKTISKKANLFAASRFVLPEHRELYRQIQEEQRRYVPPALDDEERAELSERIWAAYQRKQPIRITHVESGVGERHDDGCVAHIDPTARILKLSGAGGSIRISFDAVLKVEQ
ncbi:YolD-like family protein [Brevibacillus fluminis]|uniref:YolD-like family protein n=1 Tax=Brevibacillus fluminis TaxID=511487 RepID=UPI003F8A7F35